VKVEIRDCAGRQGGREEGGRGESGEKKEMWKAGDKEGTHT